MNAFSPRHHTANNTNAEDVQPTVDEVEQLRKRGKPFCAEPVGEHHFLSNLVERGYPADFDSKVIAATRRLPDNWLGRNRTTSDRYRAPHR